ncbi:MAG: alanine--glyoxylate aminotransferase family protein [Armatimonadetes bacterium]|nr:alanine--glyoxylate aminotransferase family protein [Armatimonadota bacterium]
MQQKTLLMIPGPTPVPEDVLRAVGRPMINHRSAEYIAMQRELISGLRTAFQTTGEVQIFPASGTGGLEAALVNVLSPGDEVVAAPVGAFGDRFAEIAEVYGARVCRIPTEWGSPVEPEQVIAALGQAPAARALLLTHNETSTGVLNDIQGIAAAARATRPDLLILVDGISGMLAADLRTDEWGLDVVVGGSQKAWMIPPGLTFLALSERAWRAHATARMPRFYFDITRMRRAMEKGQTPYTPALPQLFGLQVALRRILSEGLPASFARHERLGRATRRGAEALGLELFACRRHSPALTALCAPEGIPSAAVRRGLRDNYGVEVAGGQGAVQDRVFRIGHLGWVSEHDLLASFGALERVLRDLGRPVTLGAGVRAVQEEFARQPREAA